MLICKVLQQTAIFVVVHHHRRRGSGHRHHHHHFYTQYNFLQYITAERRAMNLFFMTSAHSTGPAHSSRAQIDADEAEETARGGHSYYLARNV